MSLSCLKGFNNAAPLPDPNAPGHDSKEHLLEQIDTAHDM